LRHPRLAAGLRTTVSRACGAGRPHSSERVIHTLACTSSLKIIVTGAHRAWSLISLAGSQRRARAVARGTSRKTGSPPSPSPAKGLPQGPHAQAPTSRARPTRAFLEWHRRDGRPNASSTTPANPARAGYSSRRTRRPARITNLSKGMDAGDRRPTHRPTLMGARPSQDGHDDRSDRISVRRDREHGVVARHWNRGQSTTGATRRPRREHRYVGARCSRRSAWRVGAVARLTIR